MSNALWKVSGVALVALQAFLGLQDRKSCHTAFEEPTLTP